MISKATLRNWDKLKVKNRKEKLKSRANKLNSQKIIIPREYFKGKNFTKVKEILTYIEDNNLSKSKAINSLAIKLLLSNDLLKIEDKIICKQNNVREILDDIGGNYDRGLIEKDLPEEQDALGLIYQCLLKEGEKNKNGSYYTPLKIIEGLTKDIKLKEDDKILDPCCGSGIFLLQFDTLPQNLYGIDNDKTATLIAKINLIIKFKATDFKPNIICGDFLLTTNMGQKFDYILTNPPWGTKYEQDYSKLFNIKSREIFSYFLIKSSQFLANNGNIRFVLPKAAFEVDVHRDIRKFIFENFGIEEIIEFGKCFEGVTSKVNGISLIKDQQIEKIKVKTLTEEYEISSNYITKDKAYRFSTVKDDVNALIKKIYTSSHQSLAKCDFGLGIVTGDNENKLSREFKSGYKPIYTGKELQRYKLKQNKFFIKYDRKNLQQVASDNIYFAEEKLAYKFISSRLVFAYDNSQSLFLNSANLLVPKDIGMSAKSLCLILNSKLFNFIYKNLFGQIKILKSNLCQLPLPIINKNTDQLFIKIFDEMKGFEQVEKTLAKYFSLTEKEIEIVNKNAI